MSKNSKVVQLALIVLLINCASCKTKESGVVQYVIEYSYQLPIDTAILFFNETSFFSSRNGFNNHFSFQIKDVINELIIGKVDYSFSVPTEVFTNEYEQISQFDFFEETAYTKEPLEIIDWNISSDTLNFGGFICQKATTHFRGRNYTAWFTREIPVSYGPWKFNGLPGLIIKVEESTGYFSINMLSYTPHYDQDIPTIEPDSAMTMEEYLHWFKAEMPRILLPEHAIYDRPDLEVSVDISTFAELLEVLLMR